MSETILGQLIDANAGRDAVHVALAPMRAAEKLVPGEHVGFVDANDKKLAGSCDSPIGIVDPYLLKPVKKGEWFFLCLYPQTTTGLRHVWTHPAFSVEESTPAGKLLNNSALAYLESVAANCDITLNFLLESAKDYAETGDVIVQRGSQSWRDGFPSQDDEFWKNFEIITGIKPRNTGGIFCCTC